MDDAILDSGQPIKSKNKKRYILPMVILAIIIVLAIMIKLDLGKLGSKLATPVFKDVPVVKHILPKAKEQEGLYDGHTKEELIDLLNGTQLQLETAQEEIEMQFDEITQLENEIQKLAVFESDYMTFKEEKQQFDENVATMNKEDFIQFYQQMYPENAQEIYAQLIKVQEMTKEQRKYSLLISEMDQVSAAKVLENLFQTDMDIILAILSNMDTESASAILNEMDSQIAARVVKQLSPE